MIIEPTELAGVLTVKTELLTDPRGGFGRTYCDREFAKAGLVTQMVQASTAVTHQMGTVRGLHYQLEPHWETKLVRCTRGAAWVVAVDLRPDSSQHCNWAAFELTASNRMSLYVPAGFAQGYQTLCDDTELLYQMDKHYHPESAAGYRFDDSAFGIRWPHEPRNLSEKDLNWAPYKH